MLATLPKYSSGLKLVRIGVFVMLLQLVLSIVMTVKAIGIDSAEDAKDAIKWTQYFFLANIGAALAMFIGMVRAIPELRRAKVATGKLMFAAAGFGITAAAMYWSYSTISTFVDVALNPESSLDDVVAAAKGLESLAYVVIIKDFAYAFGLLSMIGSVRVSAIANDQLALRDDAASMGRALLVMLVGDLFYQLTYGLSEGGVGITGLIASLLVGGYWIWCHVKLQRFLYNAAYFMNEPHNLPTATARNIPERTGKPVKKAAPRTSQPAIARTSQPVIGSSSQPLPARPSQPLPARPPVQLPARPSQPPVQDAQVAMPPPPPVVAAPIAPPRAPSSSEGEPKPGEPRFLR
ncbi:MAG TPA: hypothetical protein VIV11_37790 [Kofleriaceae bacterium]